jgi:xanthine dehydrogenase small subunit
VERSPVARALPKPDSRDPRLVQLGLSRPTKHAFEYAAQGGEFVRPANLASLFEAWRKRPNAVLLGGGTDLIVYANQRYDRFPSLIALDAVPELRRFEHTSSEITLGAGLSLSHVEQQLQAAGLSVPLLEQLWPLFSSRLIRNRATLGGNLGTASPIGDSAPALLALDASLTLASESGTRRVPLREFFLGYRKTCLAAGELIAAVHIPLPMPKVQRFYKVSKRVMDDISTVAGAFALDLTSDQRIERLQIAFGGVAPTPIRALTVEALAVGRIWNHETCAQLAAELVRIGSPLTDHRGSAEYRRAMLGRLLEKFFAETTFSVEAAE